MDTAGDADEHDEVENAGDSSTDMAAVACSVSDAAMDRKLVGGACRKDPT
jgi:hypothetical protein